MRKWLRRGFLDELGNSPLPARGIGDGITVSQDREAASHRHDLGPIKFRGRFKPDAEP